MDESDSVAITNLPPTDLNDANFQRWIYTMRREMQEILPGVFLGPYASAMKKNEEQLKHIGITHIVLVRGNSESYYIRPHFDHIDYLTIEICDRPQQNIIQFFRKTIEFINQALTRGGKVLVHGVSGISRSASLVIAYVMVEKRISFDDAYRYVQSRRFCIHPNDGFKRQLLEFEPIFTAQMRLITTINDHHHVPPDGVETVNRLKRPFEEETNDITMV